MRTRLTDLLGIELPIVQAPMAGRPGHALADRGRLGRRAGLAALRDARRRRRSAPQVASSAARDRQAAQPELLLPRRAGARSAQREARLARAARAVLRASSASTPDAVPRPGARCRSTTTPCALVEELRPRSSASTSACRARDAARRA